MERFLAVQTAGCCVRGECVLGFHDALDPEPNRKPRTPNPKHAVPVDETCHPPARRRCDLGQHVGRNIAENDHVSLDAAPFELVPVVPLPENWALGWDVHGADEAYRAAKIVEEARPDVHGADADVVCLGGDGEAAHART